MAKPSGSSSSSPTTAAAAASQRAPVFGSNVVATSQPMAVEAGLRMLREGGNAVDAAIAAAAALTVVEPTSNGIGSDAFAMVWDGAAGGGRLRGFNGSGRSPRAWTAARFAGRGVMPDVGWESVTVPGAVDVWVQLSEKFGRLPFEQLLRPAIGYARDGFAVTPITAEAWGRAVLRFGSFAEWRRVFLIEGVRAPRAGEVVRLAAHAATLETIAETRGEAFYRGEIAKRIARCAADEGGLMTADDLAGHRGEWVEPMFVEYGGVRVHELPPNGQGVAALIALGVLRHLDIKRFGVDSADAVHVQVEAMKVGLARARAEVAEPGCMRIEAREMIEEAWLAKAAKGIRLERAREAGLGLGDSGGTVYLTVADAGGMMVSFIQSNYKGFGSGVVIPGMGIAMQDRGAGFTLERGHVNEVGGGKRPFHTIIPGFVTDPAGSRAIMSFGVMGGHMQAQGHVQMVVRVFDYGQDPQTASDAPRWQVMMGEGGVEDGVVVAFEKGFDAGVIEELRRRGHVVRAEVESMQFGGAQLILRRGGDEGGNERRGGGDGAMGRPHESRGAHRGRDGGGGSGGGGAVGAGGMYCAGSDHRKDGCAGVC